MRSNFGRILGILLLGGFFAASAQAQPFGAWATFSGPTHGYIEIANSADLNPSGAFTVEAWVSISNTTTGEDCRSIAGKGYTQAWWIGQCNVGGQPTLRSYLGGHGSKNGGIIPRGVWTHVAVTYDGAARRHYIDGELAASFAEVGALSTSTSAMRIGSDVSWQFSPTGSIDEVRIWNVARTVSQLRANINVRIPGAQAGLVGLWRLDASASDSVGAHGGAVGGSGVNFFTFPVTASCGSSTTAALCLQGRFAISTKFRTATAQGPVDGSAHVVVAGANSGIFWFFSSDNWELMVKAINACGFNNRYWIYSAATTDRFFRMEVLDVRAGVQKIYFNYAGPPAPAITDNTDAFATCP